MFKFVKSIFTDESTSTAELCIQNVSKGRATIKHVADSLHITPLSPEDDKKAGRKVDPIVLQVKQIKDLKCAKDEMSFTSLATKYRLVGKNLLPLFKKLHPLVCDSYIFEAEKITYFVYNSHSRVFEPYGNPVNIKIYQDDFYYMRIEDLATIVHFEEINTKTQYYIDQDNLSFVWSTFSDNQFYTFCVKFIDSLTFLEFRSKYVECIYKSANAEGDYSYFSGIGDVTVGSDLTAGKKEDADSSEEEEDGVAEKNTARFKDKENEGLFNEHLVMSANQCFVTRGSSLGVFDLSSENLKFRTQIKNALDDPQKIITHDGDNHLLILDKKDRKHLGLMDLERGEIVDKWKMEEGVNDYFDSVKHKNDSTLVGLSDRSLFRIDPRVKEKIVAKKEYKTKNEFSCGISTASGNLAVASRKGDLRLYDKINKRAKTLLPGFGDEVRGIDTSADGSVILCTCKSYILMFEVDSNYSNNSKNAVPRRLQLKPQHLTLLNDEISFSTAKFDQGDSVIITSTGTFVIKWKVEDVLSGNIYNYSIKKLGEKVMDEDFIINGRDVVVALKNDVRKMTDKDLKKPKF